MVSDASVLTFSPPSSSGRKIKKEVVKREVICIEDEDEDEKSEDAVDKRGRVKKEAQEARVKKEVEEVGVKKEVTEVAWPTLDTTEPKTRTRIAISDLVHPVPDPSSVLAR